MSTITSPVCFHKRDERGEERSNAGARRAKSDKARQLTLTFARAGNRGSSCSLDDSSRLYLPVAFPLDDECTRRVLDSHLEERHAPAASERGERRGEGRVTKGSTRTTREEKTGAQGGKGGRGLGNPGEEIEIAGFRRNAGLVGRDRIARIRDGACSSAKINRIFRINAYLRAFKWYRVFSTS